MFVIAININAHHNFIYDNVHHINVYVDDDHVHHTKAYVYVDDDVNHSNDIYKTNTITHRLYYTL